MADGEVSVVTFVFPDSSGTRTGVCHLRWMKGANVWRYFHEPALKQAGVLAMAKRSAIRNKAGVRVHKSYNPAPGDVIVIQRVKNLEGR